jgi:hypothetical protein
MRKRFKGRNLHHLVPKSRLAQGLPPMPRNMLLIDIERHNAWHALFRTLTLDEVIALLKRVRRLKRRKR